MTIVVVFVCCHLPRFIPNLIEMVLDKPPEVSYYALELALALPIQIPIAIKLIYQVQ